MALKNDLFLAGKADRWILVHHAAHDCHSTVNVKMHPSAIVHGPAEGGKSHLFDSALNKTAIPDTVTSILESSDKAWYVHDDTVGLIMRVDEAPKIWVDGKAAEADKSGAAERLKSMTTEHRATYRTLVLIEGANGRSERRAETIESLYHATMWVCTNAAVTHGDGAISSRFFNFVMTPTECDLFEFASLNEHLNDDDRNRKADSIHAWRVKQALIAITLVLIDSEILPRPSMDVFDHLHTRVLAYFKEQGVNTNAIRKVDMVSRVANIYTILYGLICLYDNPGAPHAGKEFELTQLLDLVPYLYCTKQIAIFTMTQTEEVFLNPLRSAVLRAVMVFANVPYARGKTIEDYFKEDTTRSLGNVWKQEENGDRGRWYDFNYIMLNAPDFKDIYGNIAECCDLKVGAAEVQSVLDGMTGSAAGYIRVRRVQKLREDFYNGMNQNGILQYTGLTREANTTSLQIVVRDYKNKILYIATEAINKLHDDLLMDAFQACIYSKWQPQELLTAYEARKQHPVTKDRDHTYVGLFDVMRITPDSVEEFSFTTSYSAPNVAYITPTTALIMGGPRLHPDKRNESYAEKREKRERSTVQIKEDLDVWGHKQHHYRAGYPGKPENSPSRPNAIRESVRAALQLNEDQHEFNEAPGQLEDKKFRGLMPRCIMMRYPNDLLDEIDADLIKKSGARAFNETATRRQEAYKLEVEDWKKEGGKGPVPVMHSLCSMTRAVRVDYMTAEAALQAGNPISLRAIQQAEQPRPSRAKVGSRTRMIKNAMPDPEADAEHIEISSYHLSKRLRTARKLQAAQDRRNTGEDAQFIGGDDVDEDAPPQAPRNTAMLEYEQLDDINSLLPASDLRQSAVMDAPYTIQNGLVVFAKPVRAQAGPLTSSSSSAASMSNGKPSAKKARKSASQVFDDNARSLLAQSISMGFGEDESSLSNLGARFDNDDNAMDRDDSRSRPAFISDNDAPPPSFIDEDGGEGLEPMDGFD